MGLELRLQQKMTQQLVMTPQLQQAIKLLQMSHVEMTDVLREELTQNPLLEEDHGDAAAPSGESGEEPTPAAAAEAEAEAATLSPAAELQELGWGELPNTLGELGGGGAARPEDPPAFEGQISRAITLHEHLRGEVGLLTLTRPVRQAALQLIDEMGDDGYLPAAAVAAVAGRLGLSEETVETALLELQQLEPRGVACRSLRECLAIQAAALGDPLVQQIVENHLSLLERRLYGQLARVLQVDDAAVAAAVRAILRLDPRPGRAFSSAQTQYIVPDIYVHRVGDGYVISLNDDGLPRLRISHFYRAAMARTGGETRAYMQDKLRSAAWLLRSLHMRSRTIYRVVESILKLQRPFFEGGVEHLRPLVLKEVAEDVQMHESTISRVTSHKYVHTPHGIYELKYFFNSAIGSSSGDGVASESVRHHIERLVAGEDVRHPYSDQKIVDSLQARQIHIARRTVAKYRDMLGIPPSSRRRRIPLQA